ncbi:MAG: PQQ-binding-like beta-propeller repeat protein [Candidatus Brocadia sp.]|nr:PQQ-binding-like beta-propeller repeat protein [Candidatus Brocadia sp.]
MKNFKRIGIILLVILGVFLLAVIFYHKVDKAKLFRVVKPGSQKLPPQRMQYKERFSHDPLNTNNNSSTLAKTPWPMFRHDSMHTGRSPVKGPEIPTFQWEFPTNGAIESSPAIGPDGTVYIGSHDFHLYAFTPSGILKWKFPTLGLIRSSPAVAADGTIYVGSFDGNLYAITPEGRTKWNYYAGAPILSSPTLAPNETILIASGGPKDGTLHAVTLQGDRKWKVSLDGTVSISSPTIASDGTIYQISYSGNLYAIDLQGEIKWQIKIEESKGIRTTPAVSEDGTIYFGARNGKFYAVDPDGSVKWFFASDGDIRSSAAIAKDGTIYFGSYDHHLYALDPDGRLKWKFKARGPVEVSPCVDSDKVVYFSALADQFYAVNPDGTQKWSFKRGVIYTSPVIGPDGTIYDAGDYAVRAVGEFFPGINISLDGQTLKATLSNRGNTPRTVDAKIWSRNSKGEETPLWSETVSIQASGNIDKAIGFNKNDSVIVGARLLDPADGELLSEKYLFINDVKDE